MANSHDPNPIGRCLRCGESIRYKDQFCRHCGAENRWWTQSGPDRCGNCHEKLESGDKYCRYCGTKVGDGAYAPFQDLMEVLYGPMPVERKHSCEKCGYSWTTCLMVDDEKYCPQCGSPASCQEAEDFDTPGGRGRRDEPFDIIWDNS